jgi:hypothetical protein
LEFGAEDFDPKRWINATLDARHPSEPLDRFLASTEISSRIAGFQREYRLCRRPLYNKVYNRKKSSSPTPPQTPEEPRQRSSEGTRALSPDVHRKWWSWTRRSSGQRTLTRSDGSTRCWTRGTRRSLSIASSPAPKLVVGLRAFDVSTDCVEDPYIIRFRKKIFVLPNMPLDNAYNLTWPTRPRHSLVPATSHTPCQPQTRATNQL